METTIEATTESSAQTTHGVRSAWLRFGLVVAQLVVLAVVIRALDILSPQYRRFIYLVIPGFLVHHCLPAAWRLRAFAVMSILGVCFVLGAPVEPWRVWDFSIALQNVTVVAAVGLTLIGLCHLPLGFWVRAAALAATGVVVGILYVNATGEIYRTGFFVAALLFMFHIIVYLYDVSTAPTRPRPAESLSYFFLGPHAASISFPIVDFKTFSRSHYNGDGPAIYQRGVFWMARGVSHLVLYRWNVDVLFVPLADVQSGTDVVRFLMANFLTYLNISGSAHLAIGTLLLFGFNLPETHHRYFLASSFTDYWRRVNIYWKDFMLKVFYRPLFFRLRGFGHEKALMVATAWVFVVSWVAHVYGAWWATGSTYMTLPNAIFWFAIGALVVVNTLWEQRRGRKRTLGGRRHDWSSALALCAQTAATFVTVCVLFSLMTHPDMSAWMRMWGRVDAQTAVWFTIIVTVVMAAKLFVEILPERRLTTSPAGLPSLVQALRTEQSLCVLTLLALFIAAGVRSQPDALVILDGHGVAAQLFALFRL